MTAWADLLDNLHEIADLSATVALLDWDQQTMLRPKSAESRASQLGTLQALVHERLISTELARALSQAEQAGDGPAPFQAEVGQALLRETRRQVERAAKLPTPFVKEMAETTARAFQVWHEARQQANFAHFASDLTKVIDLKRREAAYVGYAKSPYDALLDEYEPNQTEEETAAVFSGMRAENVRLLRDIRATGLQPDTSFLTVGYPKDQQIAFTLEVLRALGFDLDAGRQDLSAHPFTTSFSIQDVRLTTRVFEHDIRSALFGTIHECGHGLYEQGINQALERTPLATGTSLGMHESQSRFWENVMGRSSAFWQHWYPRLVKTFPAQLDGVGQHAFVRAINAVAPSLIRVEADEVTYNLHIILRFELETALLHGGLEVKDLPDTWNAKMREMLGVTPTNDADGVLQDVHWSTGAVGYFPTYSLGNLYSAQLLATIKREHPDFDARLAGGDFTFVLEWMRTHVHVHGRVYSASDLIQRISGEPLNPVHYNRYLRTKYAALYPGVPAQ